MKPEFDRETDALLRHHARLDAARAGDGAAAFARAGLSSRSDDGEHLDADELNAFAENAAPEAARTRYLSHLADCDDCRRAATSLALAANVATARDEPGAAEDKIAPASWRAWLAALVAPGAWRYAMPVVALLCVGVVALVVMKRVPLGDQAVARRDEAQPANSTAAVQDDQRRAQGYVLDQPGQSAAKPQADEAPAATRGEVARGNDADVAVGRGAAQAGGVIAPAGQVGAASSEGAPVTSGAPQPQVAQRRVEDLPPAPAAASAPAPAATPAPQDETLSLAKDAAKPTKDEEFAEKKEALKSRQAEARRAESRRAEPSEVAPPSRSLNRAALNSDDASSGDRSGGSRSRQPESRARDDRAASRRASEPEDNSSAETRKVAGRRFRRQGDSWIDTAYSPSQATTVVRRNSEQYRALVADEPEIARIAGALGGEVVIVWKGRAYRIKP